MAKKNKNSMVRNASKTLRNKRASKISKSLAGSVMAKSKYIPNNTPKRAKSKKGKKNGGK